MWAIKKAERLGKVTQRLLLMYFNYDGASGSRQGAYNSPLVVGSLMGFTHREDVNEMQVENTMVTGYGLPTDHFVQSTECGNPKCCLEITRGAYALVFEDEAYCSPSCLADHLILQGIAIEEERW